MLIWDRRRAADQQSCLQLVCPWARSHGCQATVGQVRATLPETACGRLSKATWTSNNMPNILDPALPVPSVFGYGAMIKWTVYAGYRPSFECAAPGIMLSQKAHLGWELQFNMQSRTPHSNMPLRCRVASHVGLSKIQGAPIQTPNSRALLIRTPTRRSPTFQKQQYMQYI